MLKSKLFLFFGVIFFFIGCENLEAVDIQEEVQVTDTVETVVLVNDTIEDLTINSEYVFELPLKIDSSFISKSNLDLDSSNLAHEEVKNMSLNLKNKRGDVEVNYVIRDFLMIDSLKSNNIYDDYLFSLDIGMTKNANANEIGMVVINQDDYILLWSVSFTTLEACPFYSGTVIYATYYNNTSENIRNTILVGEISGGGDAPYWTDVVTTSVINSKSVEVKMNQQSGGDYDENDEEIVDVVDEKYSFTISENGFSPSK